MVEEPAGGRALRDEMDDLRYRIRSLEWRTRWYKGLAIALILVVIGILAVDFLVGPLVVLRRVWAKPMLLQERTVEAHEFVVRTEDGRVCAELKAEKDAGPGLTLYDPAGKARVFISVGTPPSSPPEVQPFGSVLLLDAEERPRAILADHPILAMLWENNMRGAALTTGMLRLHDENSIIGVSAEVEPFEGRAVLQFYDEKLRTRLRLGILHRGEAVLDMQDTGEQRRVAISVAPSGSPALEMQDGDGKVLFVVPPRQDE